TGEQAQLALAQVVGPDPVVAGGGDVHRLGAERDRARLIQRDGARIGDHAFDRLAGPAGAADRVDVAGAQLDPAHGVVAGVGDVEHVALQADALRAVERGQLHGPVDETRTAAAELAQHAAAVVAFEHAVVAA